MSDVQTAIEPTHRPWLTRLRDPRVRSGLLGGSVIMLAGSAAVSVVNFGYNVVMAHKLGPEAFGHASLAVTFLLLASAITLSYQLVVAKFIAKNSSAAAQVDVFRRLRKHAWMLSASLAVVLIVFNRPISNYLQLPSPLVITLMALAILFYVPLGARRGAFQGVCDFPRLAGNLVIENTIRFVAAVLLIELLLARGTEAAMLGAVAAITISAVVAYYVPRLTPALREAIHHPQERAVMAAAGLEGLQAGVFFVGQVVINNVDILLVKHFFSPREAGLYAAVSLIGRVLYVAAWQVVSAMFPIAAQAKPGEERPSFILFPMMMVTAMVGGFILIAAFLAYPIMHFVFGPSFNGPAEGLLGWYALSTGFYALAVVLITYEMSRKIANTAWVQLAFAGLVVAGLYLFHSSLYQVIEVQILLKLALLLAVAIPYLRNIRSWRHSVVLQEAA